MLKSVDETVFDIVEKMGFAPDYDSHGHITVRLTHTDDVRRMLNAVREGGASFTGLDVRKPNLEEVFLKLTDDTFLKRVAGIEEAQ